jgi:hypothetical protein
MIRQEDLSVSAEVLGPVSLGVRDLEPPDEDVVEAGPVEEKPQASVDSSRRVGDVTTVRLKSPARTTASSGSASPTTNEAARRSSASASRRSG